MTIEELPFNQLIGITRSDRENSVLSLPNDIRYTNHLGTVHAGAQLALAEATSGEYLLREFKDVGFEVVPVVRRLEAKFRKPAYGAIFSKVNVTPEKKEEFISSLRNKRRALLEIQVDVFDEKDVHSLAAVIEWFVARKPASPPQTPVTSTPPAGTPVTPPTGTAIP
jgi:acyl-coenzyme A thioesterase PaaI-like protein